MNYSLKRPCSDCPFRRVGGIRLRQQRIAAIAQGMLDSQGATFPCHATVSYDDEGEAVARGGEQHCAGALIFAEKHNNANQMMRIAERLGFYDPDALMQDRTHVAAIFNSLDELLRTNRAAVPD